ncbi:hypothetical protein GQ53DRAFT_755238 [Thozetella sp. PMI_491]|nr:hypothetical protein GQ53DRAFT_755238 [Thozetella sp. PMI_491]
MAPQSNNWKDYVWLVWFCLQVVVISCVDAVQFYPEWLYKSPDSPLHFMEKLHTHLVETVNDPFAQWTPGKPGSHDSWIGFFLYVELAFAVPVILLAVYRLGIRRAGTTGPFELLLMLYAFETAFATAVCIHDILYWDPVVYDDAKKRSFIFEMYGPWFLMPTILFGDMCFRILGRFKAAESAAAVKKAQ